MTNEFTAILERDGQWYIAHCPEIPGTNGQGQTKNEARASLADAIALILEDRRQDALVKPENGRHRSGSTPFRDPKPACIKDMPKPVRPGGRKSQLGS